MGESENNSKVSNNDWGELIELLRHNDGEQAKELISKKPRMMTTTDDCGRSVIHWAASGGCIDVLKYCINMNENSISFVDDMEWTPLMIASSAGRTAIVEILLDLDAEVNKKNKNGQTALHYAASRNHPQITKMLLEKGADVNAQDSYRATPLHRAASQGHEKIVHLLLSIPKIRLDSPDSSGCTPLHLAVEENRSNVALELAVHGADLNFKNKDEKTPLDLASSGEFIRKLRKAAESSVY